MIDKNDTIAITLYTYQLKFLPRSGLNDWIGEQLQALEVNCSKINVTIFFIYELTYNVHLIIKPHQQ